MITQEHLKNLYGTQLKPSLAGLEKQRKTIAWLYRISLVFFICTVPVFILLAAKANSLEKSLAFTLVVIMFGCVVVGLIIRLGIANSIRKKYRLAYKKKVVERVIAAIEPEWNYQPDAHVGEVEFKSSKLFSRSYSIVNGDDLVTGKIDKTDFRSSELEVKYVVGSGDDKESILLFDGFFFHADFNKHFSGETYVGHGDLESQARTLQSLSTSSSNTKKRGTFVRLENPEFTKIFTVSSTDQQEARYILTPKIMEALVKLHTKYPYPTHISFVGTRVYFAIAFGKPLFEPRIFKPTTTFEEIEQLYNLFMLNTEIIKELNLNTRIWSKD